MAGWSRVSCFISTDSGITPSPPTVLGLTSLVAQHLYFISETEYHVCFIFLKLWLGSLSIYSTTLLKSLLMSPAQLYSIRFSFVSSLFSEIFMSVSSQPSQMVAQVSPTFCQYLKIMATTSPQYPAQSTPHCGHINTLWDVSLTVGVI